MSRVWMKEYGNVEDVHTLLCLGSPLQYAPARFCWALYCASGAEPWNVHTHTHTHLGRRSVACTEPVSDCLRCRRLRFHVRSPQRRSIGGDSWEPANL
jgi:hypothetical protein